MPEEALYWRVLRMIGRGRARVETDAGPVQLTQLQLSKIETHDRLPRIAEYGFQSNPPPGFDAVAVFFGGERTSGVIIATSHQQYRIKGLSSGEVCLSDDKGRKIYLSESGIQIDGGGQPISISNAPTITLNADTQVTINAPITTTSGNLHVAGNVIADGDVSDGGGAKGSLQKVRDIYNSHTHPDAHGGNTGTPSGTL